MKSTFFLEELEKWKKLAILLKDEAIPLKEQKEIIDDFKSAWAQKLKVQDLEKIQKERNQAILQVEELEGEVQLLQHENELMDKLVDNISSCRPTSLFYSCNLQDKLFLFQLKNLRRNNHMR